MALDRDTPGRPTSCLVFLPRISNFFLLIFTSKGLFLISEEVLVLRTLSARLLFLGGFPICKRRADITDSTDSYYLHLKDWVTSLEKLWFNTPHDLKAKTGATLSLTSFTMSRQRCVNKLRFSHRGRVYLLAAFRSRLIKCRRKKTWDAEPLPPLNSLNNTSIFRYPRCFTEFPSPACTSPRSKFTTKEQRSATSGVSFPNSAPSVWNRKFLLHNKGTDYPEN